MPPQKTGISPFRRQNILENTGIFPYIAGEFKRGSHLFAGEFKRGSHVLWGVIGGRTMLRGTLTVVIQFAGDVREGAYIAL